MADQRQASAVEKAPDALGKDGRVGTVTQMLRGIQSQAFNLKVEQVANALDDEAPAPMAPNRTVAEHRKFLEAAEKRLLDEYSDLLPDIRRQLGQD